MERVIRIGVLVSGCSQKQAKGLTAFALQNWGQFLNAWDNFVTNFGTDDWKTNESAIEQFVKQCGEGETTYDVFGKRFEDGNTAESRRKLIEEIKCRDWSDKNGLKLVVDGGLMTGGTLKEIQSNVDRYLAGTGQRKVLPERETQVAKVKQPEPSVPFSTIAAIGLVVLLCVGFLYSINNESLVEMFPAHGTLKAKAEREADDRRKKDVKDAEDNAVAKDKKKKNSEIEGLEKKLREQKTQIEDNDKLIAEQLQTIENNKNTITEFKSNRDDKVDALFHRVSLVIPNLEEEYDVESLKALREAIDKRLNELQVPPEQPNSPTNSQGQR
jgi:hypothetical protein